MLEAFTFVVNTGAFPPAYAYLVFAIVVVFIYQVLKRKEQSLVFLPITSMALTMALGLLFSIHYFEYVEYSKLTCFTVYCIIPCLVMLAGYVIVYTNEGACDSVIKKLIYAIVLACALHASLDIIANLNNDRWHLVDFFTGEKSATNLAVTNTFIFSLVPALVLERRTAIKVAGFICLGISIAYAFILGTRTQLVMSIIVCVTCFLVSVNKGYIKSIDSKIVLKLCMVILALSVAVVAAYAFDLMGFRTSIENSNLAYRFVDVDTTKSDSFRLNLLGQGVAGLFEYPNGGNVAVAYFHNYWLDIARVGGILPFAISIALSVVLFIHMARVFNHAELSDALKFALLGIYIGVNLNYFTEPIMDGYLDLMYRFILVNGMVEALYYLKVKRRALN